MKYTVIIPNYNKSQFILETLESLKKQTFQDFDCIVFDDGSTDNSKQIIEQFIDNKQYFAEFNPVNNGIAKTLNKAFNLLTKNQTEFGIILASDDIVEQNWIEEMVKLQKETNADFVTTAGKRFGTATETFSECSAGMYRIKMWQNIKGRDETLKHVSDTDMKMKMYKNGYKKRVVPNLLYNWRSYNWQDSRIAGNTDGLVDSIRKKYNLTETEKTTALTKPFN